MAKNVVAEVFSSVSKYYDFFLNLITLGRIKSWQRDMLSLLGKDGNLLDVGTGTGEVLVQSNLKGMGVGIDISFEMLKIAKNKCKECSFVLADAENLPFKESTFENITLSLVYRHLYDRKSFLREAHRVLIRGGSLAILDINKFWLTPILVFFMKFPIKPLGLLLFGRIKWDFFIHSLQNSIEEKELKRELEEAGFKVKTIQRKLLGIVYITVAEKV
ncbi:class I SAM-dependent methyltransferase [Thermocrinis sp.]